MPMNFLNPLAYLLAVGYGISFLFYLLSFTTSRDAMGRWGSCLLLVSTVLHLFFLVSFTWIHKRIPLAHVTEAMTLLAWFAATVYLILEWRLGEKAFGTFLMPIPFALQLIAALGLEMNRPVAPILRDVLFEVHAIAILLAYAAFALSFIASLMYVLLYREVTHKQWGMLYVRLPSLQFLSEFSLHAGLIGFGLITFGIVMGSWNGIRVWSSGWSLDSKILTTFGTWLVYGLFVLLYRLQGWRGRRNAYLSIFGFLWVLFSFLIVTNYLSGIHSF